jgi:hypothetical protein
VEVRNPCQRSPRGRLGPHAAVSRRGTAPITQQGPLLLYDKSQQPRALGNCNCVYTLTCLACLAACVLVCMPSARLGLDVTSLMRWRKTSSRLRLPESDRDLIIDPLATQRSIGTGSFQSVAPKTYLVGYRNRKPCACVSLVGDVML